MLIKGLATPPPDSLSQQAQSWSEKDRSEFAQKMQEMYDKRVQALRDNGLWNEMEQRERDFLLAGATEISLQALIDAKWLAESITCLLWALGAVPEIPPYDQRVGYAAIKEMKHPTQIPALRGAEIIERQRGIAETWHWRARTRQLQEDGRLSTALPAGFTIETMLEMASAKAAEANDFSAPIGGDFPAFGKPYRDLTADEFSIVTSIAMERHHALNWLCGYAPDNRWSETPTDT